MTRPTSIVTVALTTFAIVAQTATAMPSRDAASTSHPASTTPAPREVPARPDASGHSFGSGAALPRWS